MVAVLCAPGDPKSTSRERPRAEENADLGRVLKGMLGNSFFKSICNIEGDCGVVGATNRMLRGGLCLISELRGCISLSRWPHESYTFCVGRL